MTPEERREREIVHLDYCLRMVQQNSLMNVRDAAVLVHTEMQKWRDEHEPAVADAIRYGLEPSGAKVAKFVHYRQKDHRYGTEFEQEYSIDSPVELCTWGDCCAEARVRRDNSEIGNG